MVVEAVADVVIRQLWPRDRRLIRETFERIGVQTRYMRYGIPVHDPDSVLSWMADLDGVRNLALGAFLPTTGALLGGARYATATDGTYAEVAEVVVDAWQGRRIGPRLLSELVQHAQHSGTLPLRASVLPDNKRAQRMLRTFGGWHMRSRRDGFMEYELRIESGRQTLLTVQPA